MVREFAASKDGTKVPVNIMIPKGAKLDGTNPCLVTGYGGYGVNIVPAFAPELRILFDHGFIVAEANLRGGGEYGEAWHRAGNLVEQAKRLRRLRRGAAAHDRRTNTRRRSTWRSWAAATAAC